MPRFPSLRGIFYTLTAAACGVGAGAGCTAQMVSKVPPRRGPVPEVGWIDHGRGEVRYAVEGWGWVVAQRRKTALRKIRKFCKGMDYKITEEYVKEDVETPFGSDDLAENLGRGTRHYNVHPFNHLFFECAPRPESKP